jgi:pectate lyase/pectin methylesterase-like acyl-CoA thioesterase
MRAAAAMAASLAAVLTLAAPPAAAQSALRPQWTAAQAHSATVAHYLAQGTTPWQPASASALFSGKPDITVAASGPADFRDLQAAFDALPTALAPGKRYTIGIAPGDYRGQFCLRAKVPLRLIGLGAHAGDVRIVGDRYNGLAKQAGVQAANPCLPDLAASSYGTAGSATLGVFASDVQMVHLTVENDAMAGVHLGVSYPSGASEAGGAQGVALMTEGDRIQLEDVHLRGHQDTFYVRDMAEGTGDRVYVRNSLVSGDVDFIFGPATLVIEQSLILSRAHRRTPGSGGHVLAPSTAAKRSLGMLVHNSRLLAEPGVRDASISLGRAWDFGVAKGAWQSGVSPNGQALIRDSQVGPHFNGWGPSTSRRPFSDSGPEANRMGEWNNTAVPALGAGATAVLADKDGWGSAQGGTQGGAQAAPAQVFIARNRGDLLRAFAAGDKAKIVHVIGRIDLSADASGRSLGLDDLRDPAWDPAAFQAAFDPAVWGKKPPQGPQEDARQRSARKQAAHTVLNVPSNTSIIGFGSDAQIVFGTLNLDRVDNIIIRNIHFSDAYDYFPAWDPKDNAEGEWNSEYDNITIRRSSHIWVDHCSFDDGARTDELEPSVFGRPVQHHDGLLDITQQSNWITVSWNYFHHHDKVTLVGNSDSQTLDEDKLKVSFHHNWYDAVKERTPRVRYGQVHVYNNLFTGSKTGPYPYGYSLGVGYRSAIVSERNVWALAPDVPVGVIARSLKGDRLLDRDSLVNGQPAALLAGLQSSAPQVPWSAQVGWQPSLHLPLEPTAGLEARIRQGAGAGRAHKE